MPTERRKKVSLKKAAKTYRKTHTKAKTEHEGSHYFDENANPYSIGTSERKLKYKPKARSGTYGGSSPAGVPVTKRIRRNKV